MAYHTVMKMLYVVQNMMEDNKASSFAMPQADLSVTSGSMSAKSGVGTEQLSAISAALEALQASMLTTMLTSTTSSAGASDSQLDT